MLKKLFFIGLGFSIIVAKKSVSYILANREQSNEIGEIDADIDVIVVETKDEPTGELILSQETDDTLAAEEVVVASPQNGASSEKQDNLTEIKGIGPTYAKRLAAAGILTFASLSEQSPDALRSITQAKGQSADPESWITQAVELSS